MTDPDALTYERAAVRIVRFIAVIGALGTAVAFAGWGWRSGAGFLLGALVSGLNFQILKGLVDRLGGERPAGGGARITFRYLLLGAGAYVILKLSPISLRAALAGIFVFTAAVFVEVAVEIFYGRK